MHNKIRSSTVSPAKTEKIDSNTKPVPKQKLSE